MAILSDLPIDFSIPTLQAAVQALVRARSVLGAGASRVSIAEIGLREEDLDWLHAWVKSVSLRTVEGLLHPEESDPISTTVRKQRFALGTMLLVYAAESARRSYPIESTWMLPPAEIFRRETRSLLYLDREPSPAYLSALREAGRGLGLRTGRANGNGGFLASHAGSEALPAEFNYFLLVQAGLTDARINRRLSDWLLGEQCPSTMTALLDEEGGSAGFRRVWTTMQAYQRHEIGEEWLRAELSASPWILPQWIDRIAEAIVLPSHAIVRRRPPLPGKERASQPVEVDAMPENGGDLFAAITPYGGVKTIIKAIRALRRRIECFDQPEASWSVAELRLTDYDYFWLRVWVKRVETVTADHCGKKSDVFVAEGQKVSLQAGMGLLLLLWMAETARRTAVEGELWPHLASDHFPDEVNEILFTQGQPSQPLREMMRAAVRQFNLRNVLDREGVQRWFDTVFLQFGFTARGFPQRLPEWLAGQATTRAISTLLDPREGSRSFETMWEALRAYRDARLSAVDARAALAGSPWALPEWIDDLLASAREEIGALPNEVASDSFLTKPLLRWPPGNAPYFLCRVADNLSAFNLTDSEYNLLLDGQVCAQLLRQTDGTYLPVPSREIVVPFDRPRATVSLVNPKGETASERELVFWSSDEDVVVFRFPSGLRLEDAFTGGMSTNGSYGVLLASDLEIDPKPQDWRSVARGEATLYRFTAGWPANTQVRLDGELLWQPNAMAQAEPVWSGQIGLFAIGSNALRWDEEFRAKIIHPENIEVQRARCQGRYLEIKPVDSTETHLGAIAIPLGEEARSLEFRIGLASEGKRYTVRRRLDLNLIGAAHLQAGVWRGLNKHSLLTVEEAKRDLFRISLPKQWQDRPISESNLCLFEGESISRPLPKSNRPIGSLSGWGAPLKIRPLFNANGASFRLSVAGSVVRHGVLTEVVVESLKNGKAPLLRLGFDCPIEPGAEHCVVWWGENGKLELIAPRYWDEAEGRWWWVCDLPDHEKRYIAVAVAYRGEQLGVWWQGRYWTSALAVQVEADAIRAAALMRWFHLPLLSENGMSVLRPLISQNPSAFLLAWKKFRGLPAPLSINDAEPEIWFSVMRALFREFEPNSEQAEQMLFALTGADSTTDLLPDLFVAVRHLCSIDPFLLAKVLKHWECPQKERLLRELRLQLADVSTEQEIQRAKKQLLTDGAAKLGGNPGFIEIIINRGVRFWKGEKMDDFDRKNLQVFARVDELRRRIAIDLI